MRALELAAAGAADARLVENANQIDDGISAGELARQPVAVEDIALGHLYARAECQLAMAAAIARRHHQFVAVACEAAQQGGADEAAAAENDDAHFGFLVRRRRC